MNASLFSTGETFREIFQSAAEGILLVDTNGIIQLANPATEKMFGYDTGELSGKPLENLLPQRFRQAHIHQREIFHKNPAPRRMGVGRDLLAIRKDGSEFPVEVSLSHHTVNNSLLIMAFVIDITERKKAEEAIRRSEEQLLVYAAELERKVQARTDALNKTVQDLEKANQFLQEQIAERKKAEEEARRALERERELNELKSKFVSIASHEFRTPLSTVLSSASLIAQYREKGDLDKIDKHIQRIKSAVNHLTAILNDFLSLGKLEEGRIDVQKEEVKLDQLIQEAMDEMRPQLKEAQRMHFRSEGQPQPAATDVRIMRNILFNLLSNASKYSDPGKSIDVYLRFWKNHFEISIRDEGIGIPKADQKHLFERFFRASNSGNIQGTGLGLNIVKRYVELLGGEINFTSEEGRGTTFTLSFPYH
ncbi:MAG: PAS domain-containing sensor histidine kinase [Cyclobacteriaceae bacterium]|nr:PAS domain-containing sensor histidine kinase [Cyclobacteriaceae bacterium]MDW8330192.1 PAS domain-containing sensor histidine kinase [Cyclobacteriaceae bacterium]